MARYEGFAGGLKKKWGPASPAPNVDPNRLGPDLFGCHTASPWLPQRPRGAPLCGVPERWGHVWGDFDCYGVA